MSLKRSNRHRLGLALIPLGSAALIFGSVWLYMLSAPDNIGKARTVTISLRKPQRMSSLGELLQEKGLIRNRYAFLVYTRLRDAQGAIRSGRIYTMNTGMSLPRIVDTFLKGGLPIHVGVKITIPEGFNLYQIGERLQVNGVISLPLFLKAAHDPSIIRGLRCDFTLPKNSLEGYLFPDTYYFRHNTPVQELLQTMITNFEARFARPYQQDIAHSGHSMNTIVTEASLIEREAEVPQDRAKIAGVIENRLKKHIRLEIDATVLYAIGHHKSRVLYKDLKTPSPYNTYLHKGLPPGPIACPGLPSLEAALHPERHDYLYYVAGPGGAHIFSRTLSEHKAVINRLRNAQKKEAASK